MTDSPKSPATTDATNATISIQEIIQRHSRGQLCSECGVVLADVQCRNCEDAFCAACSQRLHARGNRTQHVIVSLKDIAAAQSFRVDSPRSFAAQLRDDFGNSPMSATPFSPGRRVCPLHSISDEPQVSFCMGCRVFVCQKCIAETHAGHSLMKPRSALFRSFDRMQESCEALFDRKNRIEKALLDLSQLEASIASETHRMEEMITAYTNQLHALVDERAQFLRSTLFSLRAEKQDRITSQTTELSSAQASIAEALTHAEQLMQEMRPLSAAAASLESESFPGMLLSLLEAVDRVVGLRDLNVPLAMPTTDNYHLTLDTSRQLASLRQIAFTDPAATAQATVAGSGPSSATPSRRSSALSITVPAAGTDTASVVSATAATTADMSRPLPTGTHPAFAAAAAAAASPGGYRRPSSAGRSPGPLSRSNSMASAKQHQYQQQYQQQPSTPLSRPASSASIGSASSGGAYGFGSGVLTPSSPAIPPRRPGVPATAYSYIDGGVSAPSPSITPKH